MNDKLIFPFVEIIFIDGAMRGIISGVRFQTYVRKKHNGKYYLQNVIRRIDYQHPVDMMTVWKDQQLFFADVYNVIMFSKISPKIMVLRNGYTRPLVELDKNQQSEEERCLYIDKNFNSTKP